MSNSTDLDEDNIRHRVETFPHQADQLRAKANQDGYQQALNDFCLTELLEKLSQVNRSAVEPQCLASVPEELDSLAALLIQQLTSSLDSKLIEDYLSAMRQGDTDVFSSPISLEFPQSVSLPSDFPESIQIPRFLYGDQVSLGSSNSECESGVVIGRFYNYATHRCCWMWRYVLWLDPTSLSSAWVVASMAWEEDLEPYMSEGE